MVRRQTRYTRTDTFFPYTTLFRSKRRPAYRLSGLLEGGVCGGPYAIVVHDRYGCTGHHRKRSCTNGRTIKRDKLERRALAGIAERLVSADKVKAAVRSEERRVGKECVSTCRSRWSPYP